MDRSRDDDSAIARGAKLLLVVDEVVPGVTDLLMGSEIEVAAIEAERALTAIDSARFDACALLIRDEEALLPLLAAIKARRSDLPVIVGTTEVDEPLAAGAADSVSMPPRPAELLRAVRRAMMMATSDSPDDLPESPLLGNSKSMRRLRELIARACQGTATILIRGETGTGKELVAREIHLQSDRGGGPLITVHCAALPDSLLESELFGYEKGAFTGAESRKLGRIDRATGGTLLLDEIGEVSPNIQVKLLRVLQDRTFERLGGTSSLRADVRFIAATHRDLDSLVKQGDLRQDLFYRLNVVPLWVPPLRARRDDVPLLASHFCAAYAEANGKPGVTLGPDALALLRSRRWPGNVRQLQNLIERLIVLSDSRIITAADIERRDEETSPFATDEAGGGLSSIARSSVESSSKIVPLAEEVRAAERRALERALRHAQGNRSKAARLLGVSRATLYNKLKEYKL